MEENKVNECPLSDVDKQEDAVVVSETDSNATTSEEIREEERDDERLYEEAHDLFMDSVAELGCDELDDEDVAPYDDIREDTIADIVDLMKHGEQSLTFYLLNEKNK